MFFCYDVCIVLGLHTCCQAKLELYCCVWAVVHYADLVVSVVEPCKVVSQFFVVFLFDS